MRTPCQMQVDLPTVARQIFDRTSLLQCSEFGKDGARLSGIFAEVPSVDHLIAGRLDKRREGPADAGNGKIRSKTAVWILQDTVSDFWLNGWLESTKI